MTRLPRSVEAKIRMADVDGGLAGDAETGIDFVEPAVGAADDATIKKHGEVLGGAGRSGTQAPGNLDHRQGFALGEFAEDEPAPLAADGGKHLLKIDTRWRGMGSGVRRVAHRDGGF